MVTALKLHEYVGKAVLVNSDGFNVHCYVEDARERFGRIDLLVSPSDVQSNGSKWVSADRVVIVG